MEGFSTSTKSLCLDDSGLISLLLENEDDLMYSEDDFDLPSKSSLSGFRSSANYQFNSKKCQQIGIGDDSNIKTMGRPNNIEKKDQYTHDQNADSPISRRKTNNEDQNHTPKLCRDRLVRNN